MLIAVDPGASGGVAWSTKTAVGDDYSTDIITAQKLPESRGDLITLLRGITQGAAVYTAYIEKVNGFNPGNQGHTFQFGRNVERPECILETLGVRIVLVTPQRWQGALGLGHRSKPDPLPRKYTKDQKRRYDNADAKCKREWKQKLLGEAQRRFPGVEVTLATADALLILDYARSVERGDVSSKFEKEMLG